MDNHMTNEQSHALAMAEMQRLSAGADVLRDYGSTAAAVGLRRIDAKLDAYVVARAQVDAITPDGDERLQGERMDVLIRAALDIADVAESLRGALYLNDIATAIEAEAQRAGEAVDAAFERERTIKLAEHAAHRARIEA